MLLWRDTPETVVDYWMEIFGFPPSAAAPCLPIWVYQYLAIQVGFAREARGDRTIFAAPHGYVKLVDKLASAQQRGFKIPNEWRNGSPDEHTLARIADRPPGIPALGARVQGDSESPGEAGWYPVLVVSFYRRSGIERTKTIGIFCKEQLLNLDRDGQVIGCPMISRST